MKDTKKLSIILSNDELFELQQHLWLLASENETLAYWLDEYEGEDPLTLSRQDTADILTLLSEVLNDETLYADRTSTQYKALQQLHARLLQGSQTLWKA
ncbi:MAG TPA: hypothetical protein PK299_00425 [Anaerolineales bacterium]|nr:hypothetical protein [Anaerolineales bacterium]